jgi:hypothetical protein
MKNSIQWPDLGRLDVSFPLTAILLASELDEIFKQKSPATDQRANGRNGERAMRREGDETPLIDGAKNSVGRGTRRADPRDLSHFLESSFQASVPSQESLINSGSSTATAAVAEALALCCVLNASAEERPEKEPRKGTANGREPEDEEKSHAKTQRRKGEMVIGPSALRANE